MRNKKISALLLAAAMLTSFAVPVHAESTDSLTILTQNKVETKKTDLKNNVTLEELETLAGEAVATYPTDGYVPTVKTTSLGSYAQNGMKEFSTEADVKTKLTDGSVATDQIWNWVNAGGSGTITIDLGGTQSVEQVLFWIIVTGGGSISTSYSDDLWETYKDTHIIERWNIWTSVDGTNYTEVVTDATPTSATKDSTFMYFTTKENTIVDKISHAYGSKFEAVDARYVKLTVKCNGVNGQFRSPELMVLGDVTAEESREVLTSNGFSVANLKKISAFTGIDVTETAFQESVPHVAVNSAGNDGKSELERSNILVDGNVAGSNGSVYSKWDGGLPVYTIDLGAVQEVRSVLLFDKVYDPDGDTSFTKDDWVDKEAEQVENYKDTNRINKATILVSSDGEDWSEVFDENPVTTADANSTFIYTYDKDGEIVFDKLSHGHQCLFTPVDARYIKVTVGRSANSVQMNEIAVLGTRKNNFKRHIISGNPLETSKNMIKHYSDMGVTLTTADKKADFSWNEEHFDSPKRVDSLSNGNITVWTETDDVTDKSCSSSKYDKNGMEMFVTFDRAVYVDGVDLWNVNEPKNGRYTKSMEVYASEDGTVWTKIGDGTNRAVKATDDGQHINLISSSFEAVKTKYIKVIGYHGLHSNIFSELVVFGTEPASATKPVITDDNGYDFADTENSYQNAIASVKTTITGGSGILVFAKYVKDATGAEKLEQIWTAEGTGEVKKEFTDDAPEVDEGDIFRAFVFDSLSGISALSEMTEVEVGE